MGIREFQGAVHDIIPLSLLYLQNRKKQMLHHLNYTATVVFDEFLAPAGTFCIID
jgi:hypothetical protein